MSYVIEVNLPNLPKGAEVVVSGLGAFENGKTSPVPDDQLLLFLMNNPRPAVDENGHPVLDEETGEELYENVSPGQLNFQEGIVLRRTKAASENNKDEDKNKEGGK